eukprot:232007_1
MTETNNLLPLESDQQNSIKNINDKRNVSTRNIITVVALVVIIIVVLSIVIYLIQQEAKSSANIDIRWCYDVTLGINIDDTQLEEGVLNKYVQGNLTEYQQGMYRRDFDFSYQYNGRDEEIVQSYNTLIEQSRFVNIFAEAYARTNNSQFLQAMWYGIDELFTAYYDTEFGGYFWQVQKFKNGSYTIIEDYKESESTAFLIKALSTVYKVTLNETILLKATQIYWYLINNFTDETGIGLRDIFNRNFSVDLSLGRSIMQHEFHSFGKLYEAYKIYGQNPDMEQELFNRINNMYDFYMTLRVNATFNGSNSNTRFVDGITYTVLPTAYTTNWTVYYINSQYKGMNIGVNFEVALWISQMVGLGVIPNNDTNQQNINIFKLITAQQEIQVRDAALYWWVGIEAYVPFHITIFNLMKRNIC